MINRSLVLAGLGADFLSSPRNRATRLRSAVSLGVIVVGCGFAISTAAADVFTVVNTNPTGPGSLKQAADDANNTPGPHLIAFDIPGAGVHKIDLRDTEVVVAGGVTIDGYTQPGGSPNTLAVGDNAVIRIQLDGGGPGATGDGGFAMPSSYCTVRGLSFTGFTRRPAISVGNMLAYLHGWNRIEGNFIGLEPDGTTVNGNATGAELIGGIDEAIGGNTPAARNVVAGNRVGISGRFIVTGNYIGTDSSGLRQGYGNGTGISYAAVIGTAAPGAGNVITGNNIAIEVGGGTTIQGNLIGPRADGSASLGNSAAISVSGRNNKVGGLGAGEGNVIAFNAGIGVAVGSVSARTLSDENPILSNLLYANGRDIDLGRDGVTNNDSQDQDTGANQLQNFPVISAVSHDAATTTVTGGLNSTPSTSFTLQFFATSSGYGVGQKLLGTEIVTTNSAGDARFEFTFPVSTASDDFVAATATDPNGNTSEFFPADGRAELANLSTRGFAGAGENALIAGYIQNYRPYGPVLIRALGPSLNFNGALADPQLEVRYSDGTLAVTNRNWRDFQEAEIIATGLAPGDNREAAVIFQPSGNAAFQNIDNPITVQVSGEGGLTGIATVEVYRLADASNTGGGSPAKLLNISTRGFVDSGDAVLIGGTIVQGSAVQKVIVRALGRDLAAAGIEHPLADPTLELRDGEGNLLAANNDWRDTQEQEINASGLAPQDDHDAAISASLIPSSYTAVVRGKDGAAGISLVEIYAVD